MLYLAYGMNTNQAEMARRCPEARCLGPAELPGYELVFSQHCDVRPNDQCSVHGLLWELTEQDLANLDILEGWPDYYDRGWVMVHHGDQTVLAITYWMRDSPQLSEPSMPYLACVMEGYMEHDLPVDQVVAAWRASRVILS